MSGTAPSRRRRLVGRILAALTGVGILFLTLWPAPEEAARSAETPLWCLVCGDIGTQDVIQNVLMLLPFGLGLAMGGASRRAAALAGFALSCTVEALQLSVVPGRDASLSDVLTNSTGAALGAWLATQLDVLLHPSPRQAARLAWGAVATFVVFWVLSGWLVGLSPGPAPWRVDVQPDIVDAPAFDGEVRAAAVSGVALRPGLQDVPPAIHDAYAADSIAVVLSLVATGGVAGRGGLLQVRDALGRVNAVAQRMGTDGRLSLRIRASQLLLRPIRFRAPGVFAVRAGAPIAFDVRREGGWMAIAAAHDGAPASRTGIGPHWLTTIMLPVDAEPGLAWELFAYLWVSALLALAANWAVQGALRRPAALAMAALAAVALAAVPPLFRLAPTSPAGWGMALGGVALGLLVGRRADDPPA
ncbi:MAG TPA: VanZ family protein [Gemmatimonadales bacterium]|nr:VanZ family protein [Gemmatimonadales bacterium]